MSTANPAIDPLTTCANEPIRIPGAIQPHGALALFRESELVLIQGSANLGTTLRKDVRCDGSQKLDGICGAECGNAIKDWMSGGEGHYLRNHMLAGVNFSVSGHRTRQGLVLEFEPAANNVGAPDSYYPTLRKFMDVTSGVDDVAALSTLAARQIVELTGFNRAMIYKFDNDWNGTVIAEHGDGRLPSYLDLRFPASDIPAQARELYRINRLRLIPTASYEPVALTPALCPIDDAPLDLSFAALRSVSPVHLEYMRNMGTAASMSISILIDNELWGLVSCHHAEPRHIGPQMRAACDFLGRILAQQIAARERAKDIDERFRLKRIETELIAHLARAKTFQEGLVERARQWLALTNSAGAAVITDGIVLTAGKTPSTDDILSLAHWIHAQRGEPVFATDSLATAWASGKHIADVASGVIAVPISRIHASYIIWFRPEVVRTVKWGGDPDKEKTTDSAGRLHPRSSFENWKQIVRERAISWSEAELYSAAEFRNAIINFVLQRAEERAQLTEELQRSNKELESFSYSISHDLRAPFRHIVGYAQLLGEEEPDLKDLSRHYLHGIRNAALSAGELVDDLLHFSQLGRASVSASRIDMNKVFDEIRRSIETTDQTIEWDTTSLPPAWGDPNLIRQAFFNIVENAAKYSRNNARPLIRIRGEERSDEVVYSVEDNGVGFDMAYAGKLFQVFQRLHRQEEYEGTGIGLALSKRIIDRHGGSLEAKGAVGKGATFSFRLPKPTEVEINDAT